jgi:NAD(P)-dependent dehydrogenase (short-subunit alcohol dehydrogenase family)
MHFSEKTVLINGGTSGIGFATAGKFAAHDANVIITGRNEDKGKNAVKKLTGKGKRIFVKCDVSEKKDIDALFEQIKTDFKTLDIAVNSAGISNKGKLIIEFSEKDFDEIISINVKGLFLCMQKEIEMMLHKKRGIVINIGSVLGLRANNSKNALYTMSKHAVAGLTKEAALEYAENGIRVNAVMPAYTETEIIKDHLKNPDKRKAIENIHPIKRLIQPSEVADTIMFLCSGQASALTGLLMPVDGGCMAL